MRKFTFLMAALIVATVSIAQMSGTYKVGTSEVSPDFTSLRAAVTALNTSGVGGNVVLLITSDLTETASIGLNILTGSNTITIKPALTLTPTVTFTGCSTTAGATQYTGFALNGTSSVTIDGSNTEGGLTKDLTFKMNDGTNGRNIIQLYGNCDNVTIKNLVISYQSPMSSANSTRGIYLNGQSSGACDNFIVQNCNIGDATLTPYYAVGVTGYGTAPAVYCTNVNIRNNNLYGRIRPVYLYFAGTSTTSCEISNNTISTYGGLNGTTTYSIMYNSWAGTFNIFNNKFPAMTTANTVASGIYGVSGLTAATGSVVNFYNNSIGGYVDATGSAVPPVISLMYIQDNATYNIFQNTFYYSALTNQNTERSCIHISGASAKVYLNNNIIVNDNDETNAYCIWKSNGTLTSNYNDLFVTGTTSSIGYVGGAAKQTLDVWRSAGYDINSKSNAVNFSNSATGDLSITGASINDVNLAVPRQATVLADIAGTSRATLTYAGAYEASNLTAIAKQFTVTVPNGTPHVYIAGDFTGKAWDNTTPYELSPSGISNQFTGIFPCVDGLGYKYLCEKTGDWDYAEAVYDGGNAPLTAPNRTYNAIDNVPIWYRVNKITYNVSFAPLSVIPSQLFMKGSFNTWSTGIELTKTGNTFSTVLGGNVGDKFPANTEYKYYTNDMVTDNWESDVNGSSISNRWSVAPVMGDVVARFTTTLVTKVDEVLTEARIMRTTSGIQVELDGAAVIELYSVNGVMMDRATVNGTYTHDLNNGVYIIRINGKSTKFIK